MTHQSIVNRIGFGIKGYSILENLSLESLYLITGENQDYKEVLCRLNKFTSREVKHLSIGSERNSLSHLEKISDKVKKTNAIVAVGGGAIIDYAKMIYLNTIISTNKSCKFFVIPSRIGSGSEASMTAIINTNEGKVLKTDEKMLPSGVIYDLDILKSLSKKDIILGSIDAITHLIESTTSFLNNPYVNFISSSTINNFFTNDFINILKKEEFSNKELTQFCILSFQGGLAQNNAGAGLCHAFSHATEKFTGLPHSICISFFIRPVLQYLESQKKNPLSSFNKDLDKKVWALLDSISLSEEHNEIKKFLLKDQNTMIMLEEASKDPCWRLFLGKLDKQILKEFLTSNL